MTQNFTPPARPIPSKKELTALLFAALTSSTLAVDSLIQPGDYTGKGHVYNGSTFYGVYQLRDDSSSSYEYIYAAQERNVLQDDGSYNWQATYNDNNINSGLSLWAIQDDTFATNYTVSDGTTGFMRGGSEQDVAITINNVLTGRIFSFYNSDELNEDPISDNATFIYGDDSPDTSLITGQTAGSRWSYADNGITVEMASDWPDSGDSNGSWSLYEGNFQGGSGFSGGYFKGIQNLTVQGTSFVAGDYKTAYESTLLWYPSSYVGADSGQSYAPSGLFAGWVWGNVSISNQMDYSNDRFQAGSFDSTEVNIAADRTTDYFQVGGDGFTAYQVAGAVDIASGTFYGSEQYEGTERTITATEDLTTDQTIVASGGHGVNLYQVSGTTTIDDGAFYGGDAGTIEMSGVNHYADASGGNGLKISESSTIDINGGYFIGGSSGKASIGSGSYYSDISLDDYTIAYSDSNGTAIATGGNGIRILDSGSTTLAQVEAYGTRGGTADASEIAEASGGAGLLAIDTTVTIDSGTFVGGDGGTARDATLANAYGGAGVYLSGNSLTINGGTYTGGAGGYANGTSQSGDIGVWLNDANLTLTENTTNTLINGNLLINNSSSQTAQLLAGEITDDLLLTGAGTTGLQLSTNLTVGGSYIQSDGTVNITLNNEAEAATLTEMYITGGDLNFLGTRAVTAEGAVINLSDTDSALTFGNGLYLSKGSSLYTPYSAVTLSSGDLELGENASITLAKDETSGTAGSITVESGDFIVNDSSSRIYAQTTASSSTGSWQIVSANGVQYESMDQLSEVVDADFGWLTEAETPTLSSGINVSYSYHSLTNSSLNDLPTALITQLDEVIENLDEDPFYALNAKGEETGTDQLRYAATQLPDTSALTLQIGQQVTDCITDRGAEYRAQNGFAANTPTGHPLQPTGVAGPDSAVNTLQGWVQAYGTSGSHDEIDQFSAYDASTYGTVIGIDKSVGKMLFGVAGGYASSTLEGAYDADVNTYHGSIYSSIGGDSSFLDLAFTYGKATTEETASDIIETGNFDSDIMSFYAGGGKQYDITRKLALTPAVSVQSTHYSQDSYDRTSLLGTATIQDYKTSSLQTSIGATLSTIHQIDLTYYDYTLLPEVRVHWLHDFNADPDDFSYTLDGNLYSFGVRPRAEDALKLGFGTKLCSWYRQNVVLQLDYDGLFSSSYTEHIVSGKLKINF